MPPSRTPDLEPRAREHVLACWLEGRPLTLRNLASALGELRAKADGNGHRQEWTSTALRNLWNAWRESGVLIPAPGEANSLAEKLGFRVAGVNLTGVPLTDCSLRTMLDPWLADPTVARSDKGLLKEGLRKVLPDLTGVALVGTKTDEMVLVAASRVAPATVSQLPARLRALPGKGSEYSRMMRNLMRHAFAHGTAVAILALDRDDAWDAWVVEHLPLASDGPTAKPVEMARRALRALRRELEEMTPQQRGGGEEAAVPMPGTPDDVSPAMAERALARLLNRPKQRRNVALHRRELLRMGERGLGPFREGAEIGVGLTVLADGVHRSPAYYLHSRTPANNAGNWDALLSTMREHGVAPAVIEFAAWVRDYSTLSDRELALRRDAEGRKVFPTRDSIRLVELGAEQSRIRAFRAYLGAAVRLEQLAPEACVPELIFGSMFEVLTDHVKEQWARRADAAKQRAALGLRPGVVRHESSAGLQNLIAVAGVVALCLFTRLRHQRGAQGPKMRVGQRGNALGVEWAALRVTEKTMGEDAAAHAYELSRTLSKQIAAARGGENATTNKRKEIVFEDVPTADLVPLALNDIRRRIAAKKKDDALPFDALKTLVGGIVGSGAVRIEELAHMRDDRHFTPKHRADGGIYLDAHDRKGDYCEHHVPLNEALTPPWLVDYVMDVARPALMARWQCRGHEPHHFLFMDANGRPFGDPAERENGKVRNQRLIKARKGKLVALFADFRVAAMIAAGYRVTEAHGNNTSHADRGRIANIGANLAGVGEERTGRLLGHLVKAAGGHVSTVARSYSRASLEANRATLHDILMSRPWYAERRLPSPTRVAAPFQVSGPAPTMSAALAREVRGLAADFKAGIYSQAEFEDLKAEAYERHGHTPQSGVRAGARDAAA